MNIMLNYIIWDFSPEIIDGIRIRWYGLFFALGFMLSFYVLKFIFKSENKPNKLLDSMTFTAFVSLIIGLRLGHCLFYEPVHYLTHPLKMLYIWEGGLASHGGAIGMLIGFYIFARKNKIDYMWVVSRAVIVIPITATMVRLGNLTNSEIYGVSTDVSWAFVFVRDAVLRISPADLESIIVSGKLIAQNQLPLLHEVLNDHAMHLQMGLDYSQLIELLNAKSLLSSSEVTSLTTSLVEKGYITKNHPTQIYEAFAYIVSFVVLFGLYLRKIRKNLPVNNEQLIGIMMLLIFVSRFFVEFIKNDQVSFEKGMILNNGQLLSLPFIVAGIVFIYIGYRKKRSTVQN